MGAVLPKPITTKVIDRCGNSAVNAAVVSVNGYRNSMEDAHVMHIFEDRMLFGVFDGHSNDRCSNFIADNITPRVQKLTLPASDAMLEKMCLDLDEQFLEDYGEGGTTGTFTIVEPGGADEYKMTICNVGDSRIIVIRDGKLLFGTEDHKPQNPSERERIERCGGIVRMGRVDGDLAVSRAFGDGFFKKNRDDPRNQKVIAVPEITRLTAKKGDIVVISCDGVFEGSFPTEEVVPFVCKEVPPVAGDMAIPAARVVDQAIRRGSKDNITCMVLQFTDGTEAMKAHPAKAYVPGPPYPRTHETSRTCYAKMAQMAGVTTAEALELRYNLLQHHLKGTLATQQPIMQVAFELSDDVDLETEKVFFGSGPNSADPEAIKKYFAGLAEGPA